MKPDAVRLAKVWSALRTARSVLADERSAQLACFTLRRPLPRRGDAYADLSREERVAIRRFDRTLDAVEFALTLEPRPR